MHTITDTALCSFRPTNTTSDCVTNSAAITSTSIADTTTASSVPTTTVSAVTSTASPFTDAPTIPSEGEACNLLAFVPIIYLCILAFMQNYYI